MGQAPFEPPSVQGWPHNAQWLHLRWLQARRRSLQADGVVFRGGNDGLNTLAPIADSLYRQVRATLALDAGEALLQRRGSNQ